MTKFAQPTPEQAAEIKECLKRRDQAAARLTNASNPDTVLEAAASYLEATDALYASQVDVPRGFACGRR